MTTRRAIAGTFLAALALALLLSFRTPETTGLTGGSSGTGTAVKSTYSGQITGSAIQMPFGTVQVQVTLANGKISDITALQLPAGGHSGQVSQYAEPKLRSEVLLAQSAQVDTISGATYTSQAYLQSVQSALDQAGSGFTGGIAAATSGTGTGSNSGATSGGTNATSSTTAAGGAGSGTGSGSSGGTTSGPGGSSGSSGSYTGTVTGQAIQMPYGTVQVSVTLQNGAIKDVRTLQAPSGGRSGQIARYAAPLLRSEVLSAQTSRVDAISGATYTSEAYLQSLQSALDQAAA